MSEREPRCEQCGQLAHMGPCPTPDEGNPVTREEFENLKAALHYSKCGGKVASLDRRLGRLGEVLRERAQHRRLNRNEGYYDPDKDFDAIATALAEDKKPEEAPVLITRLATGAAPAEEDTQEPEAAADGSVGGVLFDGMAVNMVLFDMATDPPKRRVINNPYHVLIRCRPGGQARKEGAPDG